MIHVPSVTIACAGLLGLVFMVLSVRVVMGRMSGQVMLGSGETPHAATGNADGLFVSVRSQANFAEYVPLCLILIGGLEMQAGPTLLVKILAGTLVVARIAHPVGMAMKAPNAARAGGFALTALVLVVASVAALAAAL